MISGNTPCVCVVLILQVECMVMRLERRKENCVRVWAVIDAIMGNCWAGLCSWWLDLPVFDGDFGGWWWWLESGSGCAGRQARAELLWKTEHLPVPTGKRKNLYGMRLNTIQAAFL